jgi:DNA mismatch repair protein MSH6
MGDDDEFIVPSDSDVDLKSLSSHNRSVSRSSNRTMSSRMSDDEEFAELGSQVDDDENMETSKSKAKAKKPAGGKKTSTKSGINGVSAPNHTSFLTAAEQRAQEKKTDKKTTDEAFSFLKDPKDVRLSLPCLLVANSFHCLTRKTAINLVILIMTPELFIYQIKLGFYLHLLRSR